MSDPLEREQFHSAAQSGDVQAIEELLSQGNDPNEYDELGKTPQH